MTRGRQYHVTPMDIYEKQFAMKWNGYHPVDVDEFLDVIIQDYERMIERVERLEREVKRLKKREVVVK